jgi:hypothetical protein
MELQVVEEEEEEVNRKTVPELVEEIEVVVSGRLLQLERIEFF